jgi:eukaryotic-like serine/threonine-protein kinase
MDAPVKEGEVLAGKYRVERVLGVGGMGVVVAAYHLMLERRVAVKFLLPDAMLNPEVVARFAREARAAVKIESEHVARVIDVGELPNGSPYMVMEYLEGSDLARVVTQRGALPVEEAVNYVLQASEALAEAHAHGIVHRDLKPANLFLTRRADGSMHVKVLDFGISKAATNANTPDMGLTKTASVMGSPLYMAPEQMRSTRTVDARADIWALGVILYELLTGRVPFEATTMPELCAMVLTEEPPSLGSLRPEVPTALVAAVARCLEKDPKRRFDNVSAFANAIANFGPARSRTSAERISRVLREAGVTTESVAPPPEVAPAVTTSPENAAAAARTGDSTNSTWSPATTGGSGTKKPRSIALFAAAGAVLVAAGGIAVMKFRSAGDAAPDAGSAEAASASAPAMATETRIVPPSEPAPVEVPAPSAVPSASASAPAVSPAPVSAAAESTKAETSRSPVRRSQPSSGSRISISGARSGTGASTPAATPTPAAAPPAPAPQPAAQPKKNPLDIGLK